MLLELNAVIMEAVSLQQRIQSLKRNKQSFCDSLLSEISKYEEAVTNLAASITLEQPTESATDPDPRSKQQLRDEIEMLREVNIRQANDLVNLRQEMSTQSMPSSAPRLTPKRLSQISEDEEFDANHMNNDLQQDMEYLFYAHPSGYDAARQYIVDLKQQTMTTYNGYDQQDFSSPVPVVGHDGTFRGPIRDSRNLPHPPRRRKTLSSRDIEEQSVVPPEITEQSGSGGTGGTPQHPKNPKHIIHVEMTVSCLEWECDAKHKSLEMELLENGVSRIPSDLYSQYVNEAESLQDNAMNKRYGLNVEEIVVMRLYAGNSLFAQNVRYIHSVIHYIIDSVVWYTFFFYIDSNYYFNPNLCVFMLLSISYSYTVYQVVFKGLFTISSIGILSFSQSTSRYL